MRAGKDGFVSNDSGEQGFHNDLGEWIATGWFDGAPQLERRDAQQIYIVYI